MAMDDLISRAAAIECAIDAVDDWDGGWNPNRETVIRRYFEELPAVDAAPVVHGHWIDTGSGQECSVCGEVQYGYDSGRFYCPNCGAKMDEEDTNGKNN